MSKPMIRRALTAFAAALAAAGAAGAASAQDAAPDPALWREAAPENLLRFDTSEGRVLIELAPEFAPGHVARIRTLASEGFYDDTLFHRVIDDFMAQGGDPTATGGGGSDYPDLEAEFTARVVIADSAREVGSRVVNPRSNPDERARVSYRDGFPVAHQPRELAFMTGDGRVNAWIVHCPGVTSMARATPPNSANSQFFLMRHAAPHLDADYTAWGRVVHGLDVVRALAIGEPPAHPSRILAARVMSDLPEADRDRAWVMRTDTDAFVEALDAQLARHAAQSEDPFDICDWSVPTEVDLGPALFQVDLGGLRDRR